ncbi:TPA: phage tail domain-containing protein [Clostridium botulinum]|uniref:phage tail domain-containing protein n=1 Tax=Clostridium botulinum TaxID=1491 RepID=UPI001C9AD98C|nr:phage tail domain-containing protein [Clostridium botulinum]MBY6909506.1 phage tail family protein [Clostridium botulinum]
MGSFNVNFNGVNIPSWIKVKAVDFTALAEPTINLTKRTGGIGSIYSGFSLGSKKISLKILIPPQYKTSFITGKTTSETPVLTTVARELSEWLMGDNWKPSPLYFGNDEGIYYDAIVSNSVDISDLLVAGEGTIEFVVPSGVSRGAIHGNIATIDWTNKVATIDYQGTAPSYAYVEYKPHTIINPEDDWYMEVQENLTELYIDYFNSFSENVIDCEARSIKSTSTTSLNNLRFNKFTWLQFPKRGIYHIDLNIPEHCDLSIKCTEYFY